MNRIFASMLLVQFAIASAQAPQIKKGSPKPKVATQETTHLAFVTEYVRELSAIEDIRASGAQSVAQDRGDEVFTSAIYSFTRMQLELRAQSNILKGMRLNPPFETVIPFLTQSYAHKVELYQRLIDISSAQIGGPKPGVDYSKLGAEMPKVRAALDDTDHSLFEITPMIFAMLVDRKADSHNHASHLIITRQEREQLLNTINADFGSKLDQKDPSYQVGAAVILKAGLLKDFKSSDDPWE